MARKHMLANFAPTSDATSRSTEARSEYTRRGASRSMMQSLDEMAENSIRLLEGESVASLDPNLLDGSPFADRIGADETDYQQLREAIRLSGQSTPILVRPHPETDGRYMIVFGHRRARAARELGIPVRAIIKQLEDIAHVIAQGQENTARSDLTFIEKTLFATKLLSSGITKDVIKTALTIDDTLLSRMLSVADVIPPAVLDAVGAAKGVGRDRWEDLKKLLQLPVNTARATEFVKTGAFESIPDGQRFNALIAEIKTVRKAKNTTSPSVRRFDLKTANMAVTTRVSPKGFTLSLSAKDATEFGSFVSAQLDELYLSFQQTQNKNNTNAGD